MNWSAIQGWFDYVDVYFDICSKVAYSEEFNGREAPQTTFVELGSWLGRSIAYMAQHKNRPDYIYAVDTWKGTPGHEKEQRKRAEQGIGDLYEAFEKNMRECRLSRIVHPLRMTSVEAAEQFDDESVDFIFEDADHWNVAASIEAWLPKLRKGGIFAGHDIGIQEVKRDVDLLLPGWERRSAACWWWEKK